MKELIISLVVVALCTNFCFSQNTLKITGNNVKVNGTTSIVLNNTQFVNNGTFDAATGTVSITGTGTDAQSAIGGTSTTTFYNLTINKSSNGIQLGNSIQIDNQLTMTSGNLDLNGSNITLGSANGTIASESASSYIHGSAGGEVIKVVDLGAPSDENPGNMGASISSAANLGSTTIARGHLVQTDAGGISIKRYFDITPTTNSGLAATLRFNYFDHELNTITESELELWRKSGASWANQGYTTRDASNNYVELTGIDAFSRWTLTSDANALPVELLSFSATRLGERKSLLKWITASEVNNRGYFIERSTDIRNWIELGFVEGKGTTTVLSDYNFTDHYPQKGLNYYRLKQVDFDDSFEYSDIKVVEISGSAKKLSVFPNPTTGTLNFSEPFS
ncbi:MAG: hypothetical protein GY705_23490, partial [Bacteroidetes bacterium]|nr:hypothetical protein [Bacteroidota bacterium]